MPARWSRASFSPSKMGVIAGAARCFAAQHRLKSFLHELLAYPRHHGHVRVQGLDDPAIAPGLALSATVMEWGYCQSCRSGMSGLTG